jgi:hypothetical protein
VEGLRHAVGEFLEDGLVGGDRLLEQIRDPVPGSLEADDPIRVDEVGVEREVELDIATAGRDRVGDQSALDRNRVGNELLVARVGVGGDAEGVHEDGCGREGDLERMVRDPRHERGFAGSRAVNSREPRLDRRHGEHDGLAPLVPELDSAPVGGDPADRVVERVEEHPAPELAVGDDVEAELDLALDDALDRGVRDGAEVDRIRALLDRCLKLGRPEEAADYFRSRRSARGQLTPAAGFGNASIASSARSISSSARATSSSFPAR